MGMCSRRSGDQYDGERESACDDYGGDKPHLGPGEAHETGEG
jgi:hypothetical protein